MNILSVICSYKQLRLSFKIVISLACLVMIWLWMDPDKLSKDLHTLSVFYFAIAVFLNLSLKILNAAKIWFLFPAPRPVFHKIVAVNFITVFFTTFLPGGIGGEFARWTYLGQESKSKSLALAVILLDRTTGLWAQIYLATVAWLFVSGARINLWVAIPTAFVCVLGSLWTGLRGYRWAAQSIKKLSDWFGRRRGHANEETEDIGQGLSDLATDRSRIFTVVSISLGSQILVITTFLLLDHSVGGTMAVPQAMLLLFCYTLVMVLPVTIGTWGLSEGTLGILYHYAGSLGSTGVVISLLLRLMDLPAAFLGWILFLKHRSKISSGAQVNVT